MVAEDRSDAAMLEAATELGPEADRSIKAWMSTSPPYGDRDRDSNRISGMQWNRARVSALLCFTGRALAILLCGSCKITTSSGSVPFSFALIRGSFEVASISLEVKSTRFQSGARICCEHHGSGADHRRIMQRSNTGSSSGSRTIFTAVGAIRSATVGTPTLRIPPSFFGIDTPFTGGGIWLPEDIRFQSLYRLPRS